MVTHRERHRRLLTQVIEWWDNDVTRLRVIKVVFWIMFLGSVSGTIYAWWKGSLPAWAVSAYVTFAATLVFATFSYAIKYASENEKRSFLYSVRSDQVEQWRFERNVLLEFARYCACDTFGHPWAATDNVIGGTIRSKLTHATWPRVNVGQILREDIRESVKDVHRTPSEAGFETIDLDFVAYSAETFIEITREIVAEIERTATQAAFSGRVRVRILTRDTSPGVEWLVPLTAEERRDVRYRDELSVRFTNVRKSALGEFEDGLRDVLAASRVEFQVKGYRVEPLLKGILVNKRKGVFGLYAIDELRSPKGWDYSGHAVAMCRADLDGKGFDGLAARFFNTWFEGVWSSTAFAHALTYRD